MNNAALRSLDLSYNMLGAVAAAAVATHLGTALEILNLAGNQVGDQLGMQALAEALKYNFKLRSLNLSENNIGTHGASTLAIALRSNFHLAVLDLSHNAIQGEGLSDLMAAMDRGTSSTLASAIR